MPLHDHPDATFCMGCQRYRVSCTHDEVDRGDGVETDGGVDVDADVELVCPNCDVGMDKATGEGHRCGTCGLFSGVRVRRLATDGGVNTERVETGSRMDDVDEALTDLRKAYNEAVLDYGDEAAEEALDLLEHSVEHSDNVRVMTDGGAVQDTPLPGQTRCPDGHLCAPAWSFCPECGLPVDDAADADVRETASKLRELAELKQEGSA